MLSELKDKSFIITQTLRVNPADRTLTVEDIEPF